MLPTDGNKALKLFSQCLPALFLRPFSRNSRVLFAPCYAGLTTGRNYLRGRNRLTGQTMVVTFETDTNFDGVFDEKDRDAGFDFNYGILTSRQAFSCGNLFPIVMRESGAVVIGEKTDGVSCCIQLGTDSLGLRWTMSSA